MYYKMENNKIKTADFSTYTPFELFHGKFILKLGSDTLHPIYYASPDDDVFNYLKLTGRTVDSLVTFVDNYLKTLKNAGINFDWEGRTWAELMDELDKFKRSRPDSIVSEIKESETHDRQGDDRAERFNKLLA